ncbi:hypothetical protein SAMN04488057_118103 [Cyclobacterium lianum]|uniref:Uncharacterized protein n=1 Tax=Cyclobacterium lianum TaxID=388280 RepID=A0A1M7QIG8_9BACT|nr:hypothetical protein [Cyclobacterium lianum]SHN30970.1 hypothetical protein SAMN04488057_118103 [Cyclobacterium lianum]
MNQEAKLRAKMANDFWHSYQNSPSIKSSFPQVQEIILNLNFNYDESYRKKLKKTLNPNDKAFFQIECINKDCVYGGFNLSSEVRGMISKKVTEYNGHQTCNGYQDFERYKAKDYHCLCKLNYEIEIKYQDGE